MSTQDSATTADSTGAPTRNHVVSRVLYLSIFFIGAGLFAAIGFGLAQLEFFAEYQLTYFVVGTAIGVVGLLLWLLTR